MSFWILPFAVASGISDIVLLRKTIIEVDLYIELRGSVNKEYVSFWILPLAVAIGISEVVLLRK